MSNTYKIILNPTSGNGNGANAIPQIERLLNQHHLSFDLVRTERVGHAIELTRQAVRDGYKAIIAAGGDGTVNEVINGLVLCQLEGLTILSLGRIRGWPR